METISNEHRRLYNDVQLAQLSRLIELLYDQPLSVCDVDPEENVVNPYYKVNHYPLWAGGENHFCLSADQTKTVRFFRFFKYTYTVTHLIGEITWDFSLGTIIIGLYADRGGEQYIQLAKEIIASKIKTVFAGYRVLTIIENIKTSIAAA